ncbi:MAG: hypothetical protein JNM99_23715 [Verrucomicrobiaceae bacterium]|nr:hypothetical protein [Verrucomicrobiaceae bacterium]
MKKRLGIWIVVGALCCVTAWGSIVGLSRLWMQSASQYTPAYQLWKLGLWPYDRRYVPGGMFMDSACDDQRFLGMTIEEIQKHFGNDFTLESEHDGEWPTGSPKAVMGHFMFYHIPDSWISCIIFNGRCVSLEPSKG